MTKPHFINIKKSKCILRPPKPEDFCFGMESRVVGVLVKDFKNGWLKVQTYGWSDNIETIVEFKLKNENLST